MEKKRRYLVELVRPKGMTDTEVCYLIQDAIKAEPGHLPDCNPFFHLDRRTVKVKSFSRVMQAALIKAEKETTQ